VSISSMPELTFFKAEKYEFQSKNICDFSDCPRPHSCMGLIMEGEAVFYINGEDIKVIPGDIIFVPITSKYVSVWKGSPDIRYISMHFIFDSPSGLFTEKSPLLQKINLPDYEKVKNDYEYIFEYCDSTDLAESMEALSRFYGVLSKISHRLTYIHQESVDIRLKNAREYINLNYNKPLSVNELAREANMSVSNFHASFKKAFGTSPITYKNKVCISHATRMLIDNRQKSIEEISEELGFSSAVYFRRIFKSETGKTPREYRLSEQTKL